MYKPNRLTTLYIDFDAFFAHVEKQLDPALHDRAVGVTPLPSPYSGLIACCYKAKALGVKRGMKRDEARALCPDIVFRHARHEIYVKMHHEIIRVVEDYAPVIKAWSIDEVECRLPRLTQRAAVELAEDMRTGLAREIGPLITPSIGLSSNQLLAKIAAEMHKPRGLIVLPPEELPGKLLSVPLGDVPGIASGMLTRLQRANVHTMTDLYALAPKQARAIWGNVEGERLWAQLHGYVTERPATKRSMFGHSRVLSGDWRHKDKARDCLILLAAKATRRLRNEGFVATKLSVGIKDDNGQRARQELQFPPSKDDFTLLAAARSAFDQAAQQTIARRYQSITVFLHGLHKDGQVAGDLFEQGERQNEKARYERVSDLMDQVNRRYGGNTLHLGTRNEPPGGYAGAKIAFGRIPDFEDFSV